MAKTKTAAIVGAADFNRGHFLDVCAAGGIDFVVAADAGFASLAKVGVEPDVAVGDFDSLGFVPAKGDVRVVPCEKDESDMELAARVAAKAGCSRLLLYGGLSGRLDHTLANLQVMHGFAREGFRVFGIGCGFCVAMLCAAGTAAPVASLCFPAFDPAPLDAGEYGRFISVFAVGGTARGVRIDGLKYGLCDAELADAASRGLSNEFCGQAASISVAEGALVVVFPEGAWPHLACGWGE